MRERGPQRGIPPQGALQDFGGFSMVVLGQDQDNLEHKKGQKPHQTSEVEDRLQYKWSFL